MKRKIQKSLSLIASLAIHAIILLTIQYQISDSTLNLEDDKGLKNNKPLIVSVVEVPKDAVNEEAAPKKTTRYSDKDRRVIKESIPESRGDDKRDTPKKRTDEIEYGHLLSDEPMEEKDLSEKSSVELFPSGERLMELSRKYEDDPNINESGKMLALNTSELKYQKYLMDMKRRIEFYWDYPLPSARRGEQGSLRMDFKITKEGIIEDIEIVRSSNYPALDDAAVTALRLASPLNPFPKDFEVNDVSIKARFDYNLIFVKGRKR